ncbi:hypothetical protein TWF788_006597 [Orbilia oligospora]|uniref:Uncharacterized protein n=1 Tax=Orbilia oligospora TaxID=2813651 RepID=A0A7C8PVT1_ORBOL|nr:hypothetical protein TWF788_006597 [Orbilia oligospora]
MKLSIRNPTVVFVGLTCLTIIYAQGLRDTLNSSEVELSFDERARNRIQAFKDRYRDKASTLEVPEESEWAAPSDDIIVRKSDWDNFVTGLTTDMLENPMWYLLRTSQLLRYFSRDVEAMAAGIYQNTKNETWLDFRDEYFDIISPLMTEFTWEKPDPKKPGKFYQAKHRTPRAPSGLMDRAGIFDSSFPPDPWSSTLSDGTPNPYTHDAFALKIAVLKLFQPKSDDYDGQQVVSINDSRFDLLWTTVKQVYDRLALFTVKLAAVINAQEWKPGDPGAPTKKLDMRPRQTREYNRKEEGYKSYYKKFSEEFDAYDQEEDPSKWAQSYWVFGLLRGHKEGVNTPTNIFVSYGILVTTVYHSVLALMMDMLADIALKANILARKSVVSIDPLWALPKDPNFEVDVSTLRQYPEWTGGAYMTWGYPIPEAILPMFKPIFEKQKQQRQEQYDLWKQKKKVGKKTTLGSKPQ